MTAQSKYMAIYEWLSEQITSKALLPGDKIPNEIELSAMFGVHRMTVRQAIDKLVGEHMLVRMRGKGTFLLSDKKPVLTRSLETISTYHDDIARAGLIPRYKLLEAKIIPADANVATQLGLDEGADVVYLYRLMLASNVPLVLEQCYLPADLFSRIMDHKLDTILYQIIINEFKMSLSYSRSEIGAILPDEREKKLLKIGDNCPCLWAEGVVFNDTGRAVEFTRTLYRGDKYRFKCSIGKYVCDDITGA